MTAFKEDQIRNHGPSHITDLIIITIKCLMPSEEELGVNIDYRRYEEEIKLWEYYRRGENNSLINILGDIDPHIYWNGRDDTAILRMLPIVLANKDYLILREEAIKNVLFSTGNIETIMEALLVAKLLYLILVDTEDICHHLKQEIINLSQVDFMDRYQNRFRAPIGAYDGQFSIDFERHKIHALNILNSSRSQWFESLQDCMKVYLDNLSGDSIIGSSLESYLTGQNIGETKLANYYAGLAIYICNLRRGRIDPNALKIDRYDLPDVFQFDEGDVFFHSLLNKSKVIKKEITSEGLIIYLSTKLGIYKFIK
ncbi:MAG: hypothetical protein GX329_06275 [Tissierellia bacterium]|nr:hypothetical protein [Tissierellia bacterium]